MQVRPKRKLSILRELISGPSRWLILNLQQRKEAPKRSPDLLRERSATAPPGESDMWLPGGHWAPLGRHLDVGNALLVAHQPGGPQRGPYINIMFSSIPSCSSEAYLGKPQSCHDLDCTESVRGYVHSASIGRLGWSFKCHDMMIISCRAKRLLAAHSMNRSYLNSSGSQLRFKSSDRIKS